MAWERKKGMKQHRNALSNRSIIGVIRGLIIRPLSYEQEKARRRRQIERGRISADQILS